jgi:hypothetical protein
MLFADPQEFRWFHRRRTERQRLRMFNSRLSEPQQPAVGMTSSTERPVVWWTGLLLMLVGLSVPILAVAVPPLTDYPNHLARCYLIAFGRSDPFLGQMFSEHWQIIPNIGVDLILPPLMHILPPLIAGRVLLALCVLLPASGAVALGYAYFRVRSFWELAAGFAAYNALFLLGFMNFQLAVGIGLWGAAGWILYREKIPAATVVLGAAIGTVAFFFHVAGFCFFVLLIGSYELVVTFRRQGQFSFRAAVRRALMLAATLIVPLVLYVLSPLRKVGGTLEWPRFKDKIYNLLVPFQDYSFGLDALLIAPVFIILLVCLLTRRARLSSAGLISSIVLLVVYAIAPRGMKGGFFADLRLPVMLGFMVFAAFVPVRLSARQRLAAAMLLAALFAARIGFITKVWSESQRDVSDVREVISAVEPGSRVLAAEVSFHDNPVWFFAMPRRRWIPHLTVTYSHLGAFVLLDRRAFWSGIFAAEAQQPIQLKEPYRNLRVVESPPPRYLLLAEKNPLPAELKKFPFLVDWDRKFDYVLILNAEGAPDLEHFLPERLQLVNRRGIAALLKIKK